MSNSATEVDSAPNPEKKFTYFKLQTTIFNKQEYLSNKLENFIICFLLNPSMFIIIPVV